MKSELDVVDAVPENPRASTILSNRLFTTDGGLLNVHIGFHGSGKEVGEIHSLKQE